MRAITVSEYGAAPALVDVPTPPAAPDRYLIREEAAGINPVDTAIARGAFKSLMPATFPMILGVDMAGVVEDAGAGASGFAKGDRVFGQLVIPPLGSTGTYAEYLSVPNTAPLAKVPQKMDAATAASLPTAGGTALEIAESLSPLGAKTTLIVGAAGAVGSFLTQFAVQDGATVIAVASASDAARLNTYGVTQTVDYTRENVHDAVAAAYPQGIDVLIDLANGAPEFAQLAAIVRNGGTALTTRYVANVDDLAKRGVTGINFQYRTSSQLLDRLANAVVNDGITPPPTATIKLDEVIAYLNNPSTGPQATKIVIALR